jgi:hypothetical protein
MVANPRMLIERGRGYVYTAGASEQPGRTLGLSLALGISTQGRPTTRKTAGRTCELEHAWKCKQFERHVYGASDIPQSLPSASSNPMSASCPFMI